MIHYEQRRHQHIIIAALFLILLLFCYTRGTLNSQLLSSCQWLLKHIHKQIICYECSEY